MATPEEPRRPGSRYVLRYGSTRALGIFSARGNDRYGRGMKVVARTQRGLEAGDVLCEATEEVARSLSNAPGGAILRELSADDANELVHIHSKERNEFEICQQHVLRLKLPMELVDVEHLFGGERVVVYYLSEDRVDFRDLVKQLASEFQTRIEMRQIGVRDEAKLLADYGDCGKPVCCNTHLHEMPPVSMKMAKLQKATLDPTKISGRCGRLKCCLRYEYDTYEELQRTLPPAGSEIVTSTGRARVLNQEILTQQLLVQMEDGRRVLISVQDVLTVLKVGTGNVRRGRGRDAEEEGGEEGAAANEPAANEQSGDRGPNDRGPNDRGRNRSSGAGNQRRDSRPPQRNDRRDQPRRPDNRNQPRTEQSSGGQPQTEASRDEKGLDDMHRGTLPSNAPPPDPQTSLPPDLPPTQVEQHPLDAPDQPPNTDSPA
ncbi:PSP1 domain-containing protein [Anatilimnocola floriformis]|uniref:PSP1 domain-containing protein n=1 Tax=Anatilimnocola floriformis TaxID=2948575 RepID=UPI0020C248DC|nr:regulatory iron-sulfur-containing complex subunit RicT [Anatilimnocola floriformis]